MVRVVETYSQQSKFMVVVSKHVHSTSAHDLLRVAVRSSYDSIMKSCILNRLYTLVMYKYVSVMKMLLQNHVDFLYC